MFSYLDFILYSAGVVAAQLPCGIDYAGFTNIGARDGVAVNFTGIGPRPFVVKAGSRFGQHFNEREAQREANSLRLWSAEADRNIL